MVRQLVVILFHLVFTIQTFQQNMIVGNYYFNNAVFAKNCETNAKALLGCKHKCQLMPVWDGTIQLKNIRYKRIALQVRNENSCSIGKTFLRQTVLLPVSKLLLHYL